MKGLAKQLFGAHHIADAGIEPSSHTVAVTGRGYRGDAALALAARAAAGAAALLGGLGLAGWGFDVPALRSFLPQFATMKANTGLALLLAGACLGGAHPPNPADGASRAAAPL